VDLLFPVIQRDANSRGLELILNLLGVFGLAVRDGQHNRLNRRQPNRERARVMLDKNSEEALHRSIKSTVHHNRLVSLSVFPDVLQIEAPRQSEIELDGGKLPQP